ncbi:hypothetical protein HZA98_03585 [Candidatus Woesearchaeota archaeon]|nr:hypothetical protein [Candidatus Woesearchaeota archaeon]
MPTHFILDKTVQKEQETITEILRLTEKKPLQTKEAVHLYRFLNACFIAVEEEKHKEEQQRERAKENAKMLAIARQRKKEAEEKQKELTQLAPEAPTFPEIIPSPQAELPFLNFDEIPLEMPLPQEIPIPTPENLAIPLPQEIPSTTPESQADILAAPVPSQKKEYILRLYDNAVGVLIDKDENGNSKYNLIEPFLSKDVANKARELFGRDFEKDNSLFDNFDFIKKVAQKTAEKMGIPYSDILTNQLRYYLERDILGAGIFDALLADENINAVICDGPNKPIKIDYQGLGNITTNINCKENEEINQFLRRIATATGKSINEKNPILSVKFQGLQIDAAMGLGGVNTKVTIRRLRQ